MNEMQIFQNKEFGNVRTVQVNGEPYFMLSDVCRVLEIKNSRDAKTRLNEHGVATTDIIDSMGRYQQADFVNESNLYKLVFQSRKPQAEKFGDWVTSEVLPAIRKTGSYSVQPKLPSYAEALRQLADKIEENDKLLAENTEMKPKAEFFDAVAESKTAIEMGAVAKVLGIKGMGRNNLFQFLRDKKVLMQNNQPMQTYVDRGYFRIVETKYTRANGDTSINIKTLVYQKGVDFIRKLLQEQ